MAPHGKCVKTILTRGTSLIEVLVALTIFSVVLLGLMAMQLKSVRANVSSYYQSVAANQALDMLERLRANATPVSRLREYATWNIINTKVLPFGHGTYTCQKAVHLCSINLTWFSPRRHAYSLTGYVI